MRYTNDSMQPDKPNTDIDTVPLSEIERWEGYWHTLLLQRRRMHDVDISQILYGQVFTVIVTMAAGLFLQKNATALLLVGTTLVLYPALADMLSSSAAVLTASLHHDLDFYSPTSRYQRVGVLLLTSVFVTLITAVILGIIAGWIGSVFFGSGVWGTIVLSTLAGGLTALIGLPIMVLITFVIRWFKENPDNITAPLDTTIFSSLTLVAIIIASRLLA